MMADDVERAQQNCNQNAKPSNTQYFAGRRGSARNCRAGRLECLALLEIGVG